jgi:hypothetical protein
MYSLLICVARKHWSAQYLNHMKSVSLQGVIDASPQADDMDEATLFLSRSDLEIYAQSATDRRVRQQCCMSAGKAFVWTPTKCSCSS